MSLQIHHLTYPLCQFIHFFWAWDNYAPPHPKERILPFGMMELNITLSHHPYVMMYPHDEFCPHPIHHAIVSGARSEFFVVDTSHPASLLSVWFKAGGALTFFGVSAAELHNLHIPLHDLWGSDAHELYERLYKAKTTHARFELLEHFLLRRLNRALPRHRAIDFSLPYLHDGDDIGQIVHQLALSPTRFIQLFKEEIGMTPKLYSQIQRFQQAVQMIAHTSNPNWTDIALACGYYDQAHFINAFHRFSGISPSAYIPQDKDHASNLAMS